MTPNWIRKWTKITDTNLDTATDIKIDTKMDTTSSSLGGASPPPRHPNIMTVKVGANIYVSVNTYDQAVFYIIASNTLSPFKTDI